MIENLNLYYFMWLRVLKLLSPSLGQAVKTALTTVARGIAKNTPQKPHKPPKNNMATIIAMGCKLTASENKDVHF